MAAINDSSTATHMGVRSGNGTSMGKYALMAETSAFTVPISVSMLAWVYIAPTIIKKKGEV